MKVHYIYCTWEKACVTPLLSFCLRVCNSMKLPLVTAAGLSFEMQNVAPMYPKTVLAGPWLLVHSGKGVPRRRV
jgi:hypothetical protein